MKFTKDSYKLLSFFIKNNCLNPIKQTKKTDALFIKLYEDIKDGVSYIQNIKRKMGNSFYKLKIEHIDNVNRIPKPTTFPPNAFPGIVRKHIDDNSLSLLSYSFHLFERNIAIYFLIEDNNPENMIEIYNDYVEYMLVWLYIVDSYASKNCAAELKIFVYHTNLLKLLPQSNIEILDESNVNTAFTRTCPKTSEIVVFRKEEWFKAFIHETFHNFGLDFSDMNNSLCNSKILTIFPVNSEVNLFESYSEFWARIMNISFCSYINIKNKDNVDEFLINVEFFINYERAYAFFQMVKILNFMDMSYSNMYNKSKESTTIRKTLYKEDTNVLSYYIITLILLNNYQDFMLWCNTHNTTLIHFKKTTTNLDSFCKFIEKKYKSKSMLDGIECTEKLIQRVNNLVNKYKKKDEAYLLKNLRMTICELG